MFNLVRNDNDTNREAGIYELGGSITRAMAHEHENRTLLDGRRPLRIHCQIASRQQ